VKASVARLRGKTNLRGIRVENLGGEVTGLWSMCARWSEKSARGRVNRKRAKASDSRAPLVLALVKYPVQSSRSVAGVLHCPLRALAALFHQKPIFGLEPRDRSDSVPRKTFRSRPAQSKLLHDGLSVPRSGTLASCLLSDWKVK